MSDFWGADAKRSAVDRPRKRRPRWPYFVAAGTVGVTAIALVFGEPPKPAAVVPPGEALTPWPLKADRATLYCEVRRPAAGIRVHPVTIEVEGKLYGVNGIGKGVAPDVAAVATSTDTQALIDRGRKLCDEGEESVAVRRPVAADEAATPR